MRKKSYLDLKLVAIDAKKAQQNIFFSNLKWKGTENWLKFVLQQANPFHLISRANQKAYNVSIEIHCWI